MTAVDFDWRTASVVERIMNITKGDERRDLRFKLLSQVGLSEADMQETIMKFEAARAEEERLKDGEYSNDRLAERASSLGLDVYSVLERAAIMEFEGGMSRALAEEYAIREQQERGK